MEKPTLRASIVLQPIFEGDKFAKPRPGKPLETLTPNLLPPDSIAVPDNLSFIYSFRVNYLFTILSGRVESGGADGRSSDPQPTPTTSLLDFSSIQNNSTLAFSHPPMTNTPPPSPTPTPRGIWISGLLLGALVGLVPWAIAQFIPRDTADRDTPAETADSNQAIQSFSAPGGTPVFTGPGATQAPASSTPGVTTTPPGVNTTTPGVTTTPPGVNTTTPGVTTTPPGVNTVPPRTVYQPSGGVTQTPGTRPVQRQTTNRPAPTSSGTTSSNTGSGSQPIRGLW